MGRPHLHHFVHQRGRRGGANFFGLGILDISNADAPTLIGSFKSLGQTKIGDVFENKVVFIDHMEGLVMIEVSNEAEPVAAGSFFLDGYARRRDGFRSPTPSTLALEPIRINNDEG